MSIATENFIKKVYQYEINEGFDSRPGSVAKSLGISNAAVTDIARKLARKNLLIYEKYRELKLTDEGKKLALKVIRKHRLWETFLHEIFNLSLHEIHREAELLEHQTSDFLADKISQFLDNPLFDPHGDPIPNVKGEVRFDDENITLTRTKEGTHYIITRLLSLDKELFEICSINNINIGSKLAVNKQFAENEMTEIELYGKKLLLNKDFTKKIYVKEII